MSSAPSTSASAGTSFTRKLFAPPSDSESDGGGTGNNGSTSPRRKRAGKQAASRNDAGDDNQEDVKMEGTGGDTTSTGGQIYIDSDEDSDPDDPVIKSIPVFLTPALADSLALIQYPHRPPAPHTVHPLLPPSLRPEDPEHDDRPASHKLSARYKSRVGQLELSVPLEVQAGLQEHRFNYTRAKNLGRGVSKSDLGPSGTGTNVSASSSAAAQNSNMMDDRGFARGSDEPLKRVSLVGETVPDQTWYACAVLKDNEVHLTPLTRTMQMRASLNYLDEIDQLERTNARKERQMNRIDSDDENISPGGGDSDIEESAKSASAIAARKAKRVAAADKKLKADEMKAINVSVAEGISSSGPSAPGGAGNSQGGGGGVRDAKTARAAASLFGPAKAAQDETWVDLPFYDPTTEEANRMYERLFATKQEKLAMLTTATQYLKF